MAASVRDAVRVPYARSALPAGDCGAFGEPTSALETLPLVHRQEVIGELAVGLPRGERTLGRVEHRVLDDLIPLVAAAVQALALTAEVRQSREKLTAARREGRRRLRRNLHAGRGAASRGTATTDPCAPTTSATVRAPPDEDLAAA